MRRTATREPAAVLEWIEDAERAQVLMHPLRTQILSLLESPMSATEVAAELDLNRQNVNYHVKALHKARFLEKAGQKKKRNLIEQRYVASAKAYVLAPDVLGPAAERTREVEDRFSAAYLLASAARITSEVGRAMTEAEAQDKRLSTLTIDAEIRFSSAAQRKRFTEALQSALTEIIAEHTSDTGRPYRMVLGCHPRPPSREEKKK